MATVLQPNICINICQIRRVLAIYPEKPENVPISLMTPTDFKYILHPTTQTASQPSSSPVLRTPGPHLSATIIGLSAVRGPGASDVDTNREGAMGLWGYGLRGSFRGTRAGFPKITSLW